MEVKNKKSEWYIINLETQQLEPISVLNIDKSWFQADWREINRTVLFDDTDKYPTVTVETRFMFKDKNFGKKDTTPALFETQVKGGEHDMFKKYHSASIQEAEDYHASIVEACYFDGRKHTLT